MTLQIPQSEQNGSIHFDPQKFGRLNKPVIVLRKVNPNKLQHRETPISDTAWELIGKGQLQLHLREELLPWYADGFIVNDQPRDEKVARDIAKATIGFAIARSDTGEILKVYGPKDMGQAIEDAAGVQLTLKPVVTKVEAQEEEDEEALVQQFLASQRNKLDEAPPAQEN